MSSEDLLLQSSYIYENSKLIDQIHQSYIDLNSEPDEEDVKTLLGEAIPFLDKDINFDIASDLFSLISKCFTLYPTQFKPIFNSIFANSKKNANHIIITASILSNLMNIYPPVSINEYLPFINDSLKEILPQLQHKNENDLLVFDQKIPNYFKFDLILDLLLCSKLTKDLLTDFLPHIISNFMKLNQTKFLLLLSNLNKEKLIELIDPSIFIENNLYSQVSDEIFGLFLPFLSKELFERLFPQIQETFLNSSKLSSIFIINLLKKCQEFDVKIKSIEKVFNFLSVSEFSPEICEYLKKYDFFIKDEIAPDFFNLPDHELLFKIINNLNILPENLLNECLVESKNIQTYVRCFVENNYNRDNPILRTLEFLRHFYSVIQNSELNKDICEVFSGFIENENFIENFDEIIFLPDFKDEKKSLIISSIIQFLTSDYSEMFHSIEHMKKIVLKILELKIVLNFNFMKIISVNIYKQLLQENPEYINNPLFLYGYYFSETENNSYIDIEIGKPSISNIKDFSNESFIKFIKTNDFSCFTEINEELLYFSICTLIINNHKCAQNDQLTKENILPFISIIFRNYECQDEMDSFFDEEDVLDVILTTQNIEFIKKSFVYYNNNCSNVLVSSIESILHNIEVSLLYENYSNHQKTMLNLFWDFISNNEIKSGLTEIVDIFIKRLSLFTENRDLIKFLIQNMNKFDYKSIKNKIYLNKSDTIYIFSFITNKQSTIDEITDSILLLKYLCIGEVFNIIAGSPKDLLEVYRKLMNNRRKNEASLIGDILIKNKFLFEYDEVREEFFPFDIKNPISKENISKILTFILTYENIEKDDFPIELLFKKMMNEPANAIRHYEIILEKYLNKSNVDIQLILENYRYDIQKYENSFIDAFSHLYILNQCKNDFVKKYEYKDVVESPFSKIGQMIISKLFERADNYNSFFCLKSIACSFLFLFEENPLKIFNVVLPYLDNYYLIFEDDQKNNELIKTSISAFSFLVSSLQSNIIMDAFIDYFFNNIFNLSDSQLFCFLSIILSIMKILQIKSILISYFQKYDLYSKLPFLLNKNIINKKFYFHYYEILYTIIESILTFSQVFPFDECAKKEIFFTEKFKNLFTFYPFKLIYNQSELTINEELLCFINDIERNRTFWFNYDEQKFTCSHIDISNFKDHYKQRNKDFSSNSYILNIYEITSVYSLEYLSTLPYWIFDQFSNQNKIVLYKGYDEIIININKQIKELNTKSDKPLSKFTMNSYYSNLCENASLYETILNDLLKDTNDFRLKKVIMLINILFSAYILTFDNFFEKSFQLLNKSRLAHSLKNFMSLFGHFVQNNEDFKSCFIKKNYANQLIDLILQPQFRKSEIILNEVYQLFSNIEINEISIRFTHIIAFMILTGNAKVVEKGLILYNKYEGKNIDHLTIIHDLFDKEINKKNASIEIISHYITICPSIAVGKKFELIELLSKIFENQQSKKDSNFVKNFIIVFNFLTPTRNESLSFSLSDSFFQKKEQKDFIIKIPEMIWNSSPKFWEFYAKNSTIINEYKRDSSQKIKIFEEFPEFSEFKYRFDTFSKKMKQRIQMSVFFFEIDPNNILETSYNATFFESISDWLSTFSVRYVNNEGSDLGGLTRDWMTKLSKEITNPKNNLFISNNKNLSFQPNPISKYSIPNYLSYYKFVGMFIARCIIQGICINVPFARSFLKQILHRKITFEDLESSDDDKYKSLKYYLDNNINNDPNLECYFEVDYNDNGVIKTIELKENGSSIQVNDSNKFEYADLLAKFYLDDLIHDQISAFIEGFNSLIPHEEIRYFTPNELNLIICGVPKIDLKDFKENVNCSNLEGLDMFFNVISKWSDDDLAKLIMFITGTSRIPNIGFRYFKEIGKQIRINFTNNIEYMPVAHTCFNELVLPKYSTEEIMNQKLRYAMNECDSFLIV